MCEIKRRSIVVATVAVLAVQVGLLHGVKAEETNPFLFYQSEDGSSIY